MGKKALITGITGQDGSYLAEFLLDKDYEVHGLVRKIALEDPKNRLSRINHIKHDLELHPGMLESYARLLEVFDDVKPNECYHLGAQSFVHESFEDAHATFATNVFGTLNVLNALNRKSPDTKFYFAGSSEMFGKVEEVPQTEKTPFHPRSPYGIAKVDGFNLTRNFREAYGVFACSGILFNHESPRRGFEFVTRKITDGLSRVKLGLEDYLFLGNLDAKRDWGFAGDYVEAMWLMLQQEKAEDYVISTGENHTVRQFIEKSAENLEMDLKLEGKGINERGYDRKGKEIIKVNPEFYRPAEVDLLLGNATKAKEKLGWEPKTKFEGLIEMMVKADYERLSKP